MIFFQHFLLFFYHPDGATMMAVIVIQFGDSDAIWSFHSVLRVQFQKWGVQEVIAHFQSQSLLSFRVLLPAPPYLTKMTILPFDKKYFNPTSHPSPLTLLRTQTPLFLHCGPHGSSLVSHCFPLQK